MSFYRIPAGDSRRRKWLHLIRRGGGWQIRPWHRICSEHFVPGMLRKTDDYRLYRTNVVSLRTRTLAYSILDPNVTVVNRTTEGRIEHCGPM